MSTHRQTHGAARHAAALLLCLAAAAAAAGAEPDRAGGREAVRPEVRIPFMKTAPTIDGVVREGEWPTLHIARFVDGKTQTLEPRPGEFWLGSDGKRLYVAVRSAVNPTYGPSLWSKRRPGRRDAGDLFGGLFGLVHEDFVDLWVDNHPGGKTGTQYRVSVTPAGALYDVTYDHHTQVASTGWRVDMDCEMTLEGNVWTVEMAIDPASMGIEDLTRRLGVRVGRFYGKPSHYARWEEGAYSSDFPGMVSVLDNMPKVFFVESGPVVGEVDCRDGAGISVAVDVTNPSDAPMEVNVALAGGPADAEPEREETAATLAAGETRRFSLARPVEKVEDGLLAAFVEVTDAAGALAFRRGVRWNAKPGDKPLWTDVRPEPPDPVAKFQIEFYPTRKVLRWRTDYSGNPGRRGVRRLRLQVWDTENGREVASQAIDAPADLPVTRQLDLPDLAPGVYEARLFLDGATPSDQPAKTELFQYWTDFPWLGNTLGLGDEVIPPFEPLAVDGRTVSAVLREYELADNGLWARVKALDVNILAGPMRLEVTRAGGAVPVAASLRVSSAKPTEVVAESEWSAGPLKGRTVSALDYDGCAKVTVRLQPTGGEVIDALDLVIPLVDALAPLMHSCGDGLRFNYGGRVPPGEGTVWTGKDASRAGLRGSFVPYLWVGGEDRGLVWFASNDADWVVDESDETPAIALEREGGVLTLRVRLIQTPAALEREHEIVFGLQATPVKPRPAWRREGFPWVWAGMSTYYGTPYYAVRPHNNDYEVVRQVARSKKGGPRDDAFWAKYIADHPQWTAELKWGSNVSTAGGPVVPYTNVRGEGPPDRAWVVYQDEWKANDFCSWSYQPWMNYGRKTRYSERMDAKEAGSGGIDFVVYLTKERIEYLLYYYRELFRNGFDGIYWDNFNIYGNTKPLVGRSYVRADGSVQPDTDIWGLRELAKRTAVLLHRMGKPNAIVVHDTNAYLIPALGWTAVNLDWEWKYGMTDFQDRLPPDYIRAASTGRQGGTHPNILNGIKGQGDRAWAARTRAAVLVPHEMSVWHGNKGPTAQIQRFFRENGYGAGDTVVYNYWADDPVLELDGIEGVWIVLETPERVILQVSDWSEGGDAVLRLDTARLGLPPAFQAVNWEQPDQVFAAADGTLRIPSLRKHDFRVLVIEK